MQVLEYVDPGGRSVFAQWFESLDERAAAKVVIALTRIGSGNLSNAKSVGAGVQEYRIDFGPGYRIYFGLDGETIVILLGGGTKRRQQNDIVSAHLRWVDYKRRKKEQ
jgi:putative addiction module killer protein